MENIMCKVPKVERGLLAGVEVNKGTCVPVRPEEI